MCPNLVQFSWVKPCLNNAFKARKQWYQIVGTMNIFENIIFQSTIPIELELVLLTKCYVGYVTHCYEDPSFI